MFPEISVKSDLDNLTRWAKVVAADQVPFAAALTLTLTGKDVKSRIEQELPAVFDRPTPYTTKGFELRPATKKRLVATVGFKWDARNYLGPQVGGGPRKSKALETALRAAGHLPAGWSVVPGAGARLDQYGNVDRGQIIQVLSQLRITMTAGYTRNMSHDARSEINAQRRAGGRFFVIKPGSTGKAPAGVYQREFMGRNVTPVFIFIKSTSYRVRLPIEEIGRRVIADRLETNWGIAWRRAMADARRAGR